MLAPLATMLIASSLVDIVALVPFLVVLIAIVVFRVDFLNQVVPFLFELHTSICVVVHVRVSFEALSNQLLKALLDLVHQRLHNLLVLTLIQNPL